MSQEHFNQQKKDLQEKLVEAEQESQFTFDTSEVERLTKELENLESNYTTTLEKTESIPEMKLNQVHELGGSEEVLHEKTAEVDQEIALVKEEVGGEVEEVKKEEVVHAEEKEIVGKGEEEKEVGLRLIKVLSRKK